MCPLGAVSSAAMVRMKRKMMLFFGMHFHYLLYEGFFSGINSNSLLDVPLCGMITAE